MFDYVEILEETPIESTSFSEEVIEVEAVEVPNFQSFISFL